MILYSDESIEASVVILLYSDHTSSNGLVTLYSVVILYSVVSALYSE